ncbi:MAG: PD-(D/E)XK nuclease family protein, partial [Clostridia bacterium]|nr:PD-(D/E)XK nuclease family protein [Clostridia bacterium]
LQMLLYLFTIEQNGSGKYEDTVPAGILYYPAKRATGTTTRRDAPPEEAEVQNTGKNRQNGLLLRDTDILDAMEHGLEGNYIPIKRKQSKDGDVTLTPERTLASLQELGQLHKRIDFLLTKMATDLHEGAIPAVPAEQNGFLPCSYCDYRAVCRPEEPATRLIETITDREALMEELAKEVDGNGEDHELDA